ncbi:MAG: FHA domain-containing protein [Planctomycetes bacterium]|nr:FHA domain-containing protein [Planctomycetota bacterium]
MPSLKMVNGPDKKIIGEVKVEFIGGNKFVIGRDAKNNLVLNGDVKCSRHHVEIFTKGSEYYIRDLNSRNGTLLNGLKIKPTPEGDGEKLINGTNITIGNSYFEYIAEESDAAPAGQVKFTPAPPDEKEGSSVGGDTVEINLDEEEEKKHGANFIGKKLSSKHLTNIYEIARIIATEKSLTPMVERIVKFASVATRAKTGYFILLEKKTDKISSMAAWPKELAAQIPKVSKTIVKRVIQYTRPILTSDAMLDGRFSSSDSIASGDIRSAICVPVIKMPSYDAVLYLENISLDKPFNEDDLEIASAIGIQAGLAMVSIMASDKSKRILMSMVKVLVSSVEMKDMSIQGHSERVANYASAIAQHLGMTPYEISQVQLAALLHDIGKLAATSTAKEEHIYAAEKLLSQIPDLGDVLPAIKYHHERIDGTGFPYQIKDLPLIARIVSVSNTLDNLVTRGGVKGIGLPIRDALTEIEHQSGKEFDPGVVNALIASYNDGSLFKSTKLFEDSL